MISSGIAYMVSASCLTTWQVRVRCQPADELTPTSLGNFADTIERGCRNCSGKGR
jgi:hypothetical protein